MKKGIGYWKEELEEWEKFFYNYANELTLSELSSVMKTIYKIDKIIEKYEKEEKCAEIEERCVNSWLIKTGDVNAEQVA